MWFLKSVVIKLWCIICGFYSIIIKTSRIRNVTEFPRRWDMAFAGFSLRDRGIGAVRADDFAPEVGGRKNSLHLGVLGPESQNDSLEERTPPLLGLIEGGKEIWEHPREIWARDIGIFWGYGWRFFFDGTYWKILMEKMDFWRSVP